MTFESFLVNFFLETEKKRPYGCERYLSSSSSVSAEVVVENRKLEGITLEIGHDAPESELTVKVGDEVFMHNLFETEVDIQWMPRMFDVVTINFNESASFVFDLPGSFEYKVTRADFNGEGDLPKGNIIFSSFVIVEEESETSSGSETRPDSSTAETNSSSEEDSSSDDSEDASGLGVSNAYNSDDSPSEDYVQETFISQENIWTKPHLEIETLAFAVVAVIVIIVGSMSIMIIYLRRSPETLPLIRTDM